MKKTVLLLLTLLFFTYSFCQETRAETQQFAMQQLNWLIGEWRGTSEVEVAGKKQITHIQEIIKPTLDSTIFTVSAIGRANDSLNQKLALVYNSFGVISYDVKNKEYRWKTWRNPGDTYDESVIKVGEHSFEYVSKENGGYIRYKANLNDTGQWVETGEYATDNVTWTLLITMKLDRIE